VSLSKLSWVYAKRYAALLLVSILLSVLTGRLAVAESSTNSLNELEVDGLVTHDGEKFDPTDFKGRVVMLVFGFTHCPDICPLELTEVSRVLNDVDQSAVSALFVSLDPERDTAAKLADYAPYFHEAITGVTGNATQIREMAESFGVKYQRVEQGDDYVIDHSTGVYVLGRDGKTEAIAPFGSSADHLKEIVKSLLSS